MNRNENLRALLVAHRPVDREEAHHVERMVALLDETSAFERDNYVPGHFTASAFILSPNRDALLLIFHGKLSRWLQPGGHVEPTDVSILAAAQREMAEEVGVHDASCDGAIFDVDVHDIPERKDAMEHAHFDVRFLFQARNLSFVAASDAKAARWMPFLEIDELTSDRSVARAVEKLKHR